MAVKELETVLTDEPGLLGPKARERNGGGGRWPMIKALCGGSDLSFLSFCISESSVICLYMCMLIRLNLLGEP